MVPVGSPGRAAHHAQTSAHHGNRHADLAGAGRTDHRPAARVGSLPATPDWRWIFFINVPLGLIAIVLALRIIPNILHEDTRRPFDLPGFAVTTLADGEPGVMRWSRLGDRQPLRAGLTAALLMASGVVACKSCALRHFPPGSLANGHGWTLCRCRRFGSPCTADRCFAPPSARFRSCLPLLFQVGFRHGSRSILACWCWRFSSAISPLNRRRRRSSAGWGFSRLLLINGALNVAWRCWPARFLTPQTPVWLIMLILYLGGVFRSIQFTGRQYAGFCGCAIGADELCQYSVFSTATQLAVGLGITLGAIGIRIGEKVSEAMGICRYAGNELPAGICGNRADLPGREWLTRCV